MLEKRLVQEFGPDLEVFIPSLCFSRKDQTLVICHTEGYIFVRAGHPPCFYMDMEHSPLIERVLTTGEGGARFLSYISEVEVAKIRAELLEMASKTISEGDRVMVEEGCWSELVGEVVCMNREEGWADVHITELRSLDTVVRLPLQFFRKL